MKLGGIAPPRARAGARVAAAGGGDLGFTRECSSTSVVQLVGERVVVLRPRARSLPDVVEEPPLPMGPWSTALRERDVRQAIPRSLRVCLRPRSNRRASRHPTRILVRPRAFSK